MIKPVPGDLAFHMGDYVVTCGACGEQEAGKGKTRMEAISNLMQEGWFRLQEHERKLYCPACIVFLDGVTAARGGARG